MSSHPADHPTSHYPQQQQSAMISTNLAPPPSSASALLPLRFPPQSPSTHPAAPGATYPAPDRGRDPYPPLPNGRDRDRLTSPEPTRGSPSLANDADAKARSRRQTVGYDLPAESGPYRDDHTLRYDPTPIHSVPRDFPRPMPVLSQPELSSGLPRLMSHEYAKRIQEEFVMVEKRLAELAKDKAELQTHYLRYYELSYQLNAELQRMSDINYRYQAIIHQLLPMVTPNVQNGVRKDMESIKLLADMPLNFRPPIGLGVPPAEITNAPPLVAGPPGPPRPDGLALTPEPVDGKRRNRPSKPKVDKLEKREKRLKLEHEDDGPAIGAPSLPRSSHPDSKPPHDHPYASSPPTSASHHVRSRSSSSAQAFFPDLEPTPLTAPVPTRPNFLTTLKHGEVVCTVATSNPFRFVYTCGMGTVKVWDCEGVKERGEAVCVASVHCLVSFVGDVFVFLMGFLWVPEAKATGRLKPGFKEGYIRASILTNDNKSLIVAGESDDMVILDVSQPTPHVSARLPTPGLFTYTLAVTDDSRFLFAGTNSGSVGMWDLVKREIVRTFSSHEDSITCAALSKDGSQLITGSLDETVKVWDVAQGKEIMRFDCHSKVFSLRLTPLGSFMAIGLENSMIQLRHLRDPSQDREFRSHEYCVLSMKYAPPAGSWCVTTGKDRKWVVWRSRDMGVLFTVSFASEALGLGDGRLHVVLPLAVGN
ncbi:Transducin-like enhancer protein 2 [Rhizophlyctis rosea]|nr:Transducin-like enhancer protein 2 [Rhizophlyctis rosea]